MVSHNLLSYDIAPTVLDTTITHPRMENPGSEQTFIRQKTDLGGLQVETTDAVIRVDTYEARASMGFGQLNDADFMRRVAQHGKQVAADVTRELVQHGNALLDKMRPSDIAKQKYSDDRKPVIVTFYPGVPAEVDVQRGGVEIEHNPTNVNIDWQNTAIVPYQLRRGEVNFNVVQRAYIDITYLGNPDYFPDSAEPDVRFSARA